MREAFVRREVEVREDDLVGPHPIVFGFDGFLDFHDEFGPVPYLVRRPQNLRPRGDVHVVRKAAAKPRATFDAHPVSGRDERRRAGRHEGHAVLVRLYLLRYANDHLHSLQGGYSGRFRCGPPAGGAGRQLERREPFG